MKQYKVVDDRNKYRNDSQYEIVKDNDTQFVFKEIDGISMTNRLILLNPAKFQEERIVDEQEAILLMLKGVKVEEVAK